MPAVCVGLLHVCTNVEHSNSKRGLTRNSLSEEVLWEKQKRGLPANFFTVAVEHHPFSSNEALYFDALGYRVMASATEIQRAGLTTRCSHLVLATL